MTDLNGEGQASRVSRISGFPVGNFEGLEKKERLGAEQQPLQEVVH
ncbi:MAG: hypothetical protein ACP5OP_01345 [Leptospirillia bacterium]